MALLARKVSGSSENRAPELNSNEIQISYDDEHREVCSVVKSHAPKHTQFCQTYEVT